MGCLASMEDPLDFSSEMADGDEEVEGPRSTFPPKLTRSRRHDREELVVLNPNDSGPHRPGSVEAAGQRPSKKDACPVVDTFDTDTISDCSTDDFKHASPTSVLEHSPAGTGFVSCRVAGGLKVPVRERSMNRRNRRQDIAIKELCWLNSQTNNEKSTELESRMTKTITTTRRKCGHCGVERTPQWREGPLGPGTLCNACGVRYKSGRLVPEYRPAKSPTFSTELHSNSHRKIMEMRITKQQRWVRPEEDSLS